MINRAEGWLAEVADLVPLGDHRGVVAHGLATSAKGEGVSAWSDVLSVVSETDADITVQEAAGALLALSEAGLVHRVGPDHLRLSRGVLGAVA